MGILIIFKPDNKSQNQKGNCHLFFLQKGK